MLFRSLTTTEKNLTAEFEKYKPYVILIVGVNGVGKTTTIGKLANNFKQSQTQNGECKAKYIHIITVALFYLLASGVVVPGCNRYL